MRPTTTTPLVLATVLAVATAPLPLTAQTPPPHPDPADVSSPDAIVAALYDVISGGVDEERDWNRFRSLFIPGARLIPTGPDPEGGFGHRVMSPEDYEETSGPALLRIGFHERELGHTDQAYGQIHHRFSAYESFRGDETEPFARGINSIQLLDDGERWWVVTVLWASERPDLPLPDGYARRR